MPMRVANWRLSHGLLYFDMRFGHAANSSAQARSKFGPRSWSAVAAEQTVPTAPLGHMSRLVDGNHSGRSSGGETARMPDGPSTISWRASSMLGPTNPICRAMPSRTASRTVSAPQRVLWVGIIVRPAKYRRLGRVHGDAPHGHGLPGPHVDEVAAAGPHLLRAPRALVGQLATQAEDGHLRCPADSPLRPVVDPVEGGPAGHRCRLEAQAAHQFERARRQLVSRRTELDLPVGGVAVAVGVHQPREQGAALSLGCPQMGRWDVLVVQQAAGSEARGEADDPDMERPVGLWSPGDGSAPALREVSLDRIDIRRADRDPPRFRCRRHPARARARTGGWASRPPAAPEERQRRSSGFAS